MQTGLLPRNEDNRTVSSLRIRPTNFPVASVVSVSMGSSKSGANSPRLTSEFSAPRPALACLWSAARAAAKGAWNSAATIAGTERTAASRAAFRTTLSSIDLMNDSQNKRRHVLQTIRTAMRLSRSLQQVQTACMLQDLSGLVKFKDAWTVVSLRSILQAFLLQTAENAFYQIPILL